MTSAREIQARVRAQERKRGRLREAAITRLVAAGTAVAEVEVEVAAAKARLREKVLAKLDADCAKLDDKVAAKEVEAGRAVMEAMGGELAALGAEWREGDLRDLTGFQIAELRRWARRARDTAVEDEAAAQGGSTAATSAGGDASVGDAAAAGDTVVVPAASDDGVPGRGELPAGHAGLAFDTNALPQ